MAVELEREVVGVTDRGEVCIVTHQVNDDETNDVGAVTNHKEYSVRQGGRSVTTTLVLADAKTIANALVGAAAPQPAPRVATQSAKVTAEARN